MWVVSLLFYITRYNSNGVYLPDDEALEVERCYACGMERLSSVILDLQAVHLTSSLIVTECLGCV